MGSSGSLAACTVLVVASSACGDGRDFIAAMLANGETPASIADYYSDMCPKVFAASAQRSIVRVRSCGAAGRLLHSAVRL